MRPCCRAAALRSPSPCPTCGRDLRDAHRDAQHYSQPSGKWSGATEIPFARLARLPGDVRRTLARAIAKALR